MTTSNDIINLEWHQLELRYQSMRIHTPRSIQILMLSIHTNGLLVPITVVPSDIPDRPWVVIDGYLRILALKALGQDLVSANVWQMDAANALLYTWKHNKSRYWDVFEEANLLQELLVTHEYSQANLAQQFGKSASWVGYRLQFLTYLPDFIKEAICHGNVSSWVSSRILIPFARANSSHAEQFVDYLITKPHTSREIRAFYEQYLRSNKAVRAELVLNPSIFFKLQAFNKLDSASDFTQLPPEYVWGKKCDQIMDCLHALETVMPAAFYHQQHEQEQSDLQQRFHEALAWMNAMQLKLQRRNHETTTSHTDRERTTT
jgi:ParB family transcriptional regulator, chromosome partitioning protein